MSKTSPQLTYHDRCDGCGKTMLKAHRVYKGEAFCDNCYPKWFVKKPCVRCGKIHRLYLSDPNAICLDCQRKEPCIRCGKDAHEGTTSEYGRICQSCYQYYFKPKNTCFQCGKESHSLIRSPHTPHSQPICQNCANQYTHKTCPCCHRYRPLVQTDNGEMCQKCHELGQIPCEQCHKLMWAGVGKRCWNCYWNDKLAHEAKLNQYIFRAEPVKQAYTAFVTWFAETRGAVKANLKHNNFIDFFARCDNLWGEIPNYDLLVMEFKPEGLRHNLTVLRWLIDTQQVTINKTLKEQMAEEERIRKLFTKLGEEIPSVVSEFYDYLVARQQKRQTALKTVRLTLQPVVDIYHQFNLKMQNTPSQAQINQYLVSKSGQANSLSSFIVFLREKYGINLDVNPKKIDNSKTIDRKAVEKQLMQMTKLPKPLLDIDKIKWLQLGMMYFHKQSVNIATLKKLKVTEDITNDMLILHYNGQKYSIPKP